MFCWNVINLWNEGRCDFLSQVRGVNVYNLFMLITNSFGCLIATCPENKISLDLIILHGCEVSNV